MPTVDYERLIWEDYPSEDTPINAENLNHLEEGVAGLYHDYTALEKEVTETSEKVNTMVGAPLVATLAVNMIDKSKVYVYTGSETGYTAGNWYYWDGTQWQSGGVYNSVAVNTDKTLTVEDMAADGKATGTRIKEEAKFNLLDLGEKTGNPIVLKDGGEDAPVKDLKVTLEPIQDFNGYDHPWPGGGGKNLLNVTANTTTINGITYTVNKDTQGNVVSINANGTSTGTAYIGLGIPSLKAGTYKFYIFSSGLASKWYADCPDSSHRVNSEGGTFTVSSDGDVAIWFNISPNQTVNNVLFYPMVAKLDVIVTAYETYTNICPIYPPHHENLLPMTVAGIKAVNSGTWNGNIFTHSSGMTVTILTDSDNNVVGLDFNGTTSNSGMNFGIGRNVSIPNGQYIYNTPTASGKSGMWLSVTNPTLAIVLENNTSGNITVSGGTIDEVYVYFNQSITLNHYIIRPMIRHPYIKDPTFVPYGNHLLTKREGKNLLNVADVEIGTAWNGNANSARARLIVELTEGRTYTLKMNGTSSLDMWYVKLTDTIPPSDSGLTPTNPYTFTASNKYLSLGFNKTAISKTDIEALKLQLELGSTATEYEPYKSKTFPTALPELIYSAKVDITTGEMVVDRVCALATEAMMRRNSGTSWWVSLSTGGYPNAKIIGANYTEGVLSDRFEPGTDPNKNHVFINSTGALRFNTSKEYTTAAEMFADIGQPSFIYPLASPLTYHLTPTEVTTLLGHNFISSDGRMELTYRRNRPAFFEREEMYNLLPLGDLSGNPAYCDDGADDVPVKDMSIIIEPKQDLHGYDHPWPAGGGKNIADATYYSRTAMYQNVVTASFSVKSGKRYAFSFDTPNSGYSVYRQSPGTLGFSSFSAYSFALDGTRKTFYGDCNEDKTLTNEMVIASYSNTSGSDTVYVTNFMIEEIPSTSTSSTSFAPYSNICPITGYESVDVVRGGFNLFDESASGEVVGSYRFWDMPIGKDHELYMTLEDTGASVDVSEISLGFTDGVTSGNVSNYNWVLNDGIIQSNHSNISDRGVLCSAVFLYRPTDAALTNLRKKYRICINISDPAKNGTYEPYKGDTYTIKLPGEAGTVYSGSLNPVTGDLVVDMVKQVFDENISWGNPSAVVGDSALFAQQVLTSASASHAESTVFQGVTNYLSASSGDLIYAGTFGVNCNAKWLGIRIPHIDTREKLVTFMAQNPLEVVYPLASPLVYHLDKEEITTLLGSNTFTTDAKTLDLTYRKDLGLYIKKLLQTT